MRVEPKTLVRRLTPTASRMLEAAASRASSARCYEIVPEHMLRQVLEEEDGEASLLLRHFQVDRARVLASVEAALRELRTGNTTRPVFSESLFQWFEDAWLVASLEQGATRLRSGALMWQWMVRSARYSADAYPELDAVPVESLKKAFADVVSRSKEAAEVASTSTAAPGAGAGGRGEDALSRFTTSFTEKARAGKVDPIFGRDREIRQVIDVLARRRKNNPIIVGEPGVGKTALVEGLARAIVAGDVPEAMRNYEVLGLDLGALQAGAGVRGEFENRLKGVISEVKASPRPIVLFIDEAHTLIGAGGAQGGGDAANLLKPELARGELRTIAATTWAEYKKYFEKDAALERRFQPVKVEEPSEADAVLMLRGLRSAYEQSHGITIRDEAVVAAVELSHRYISGRQLPDKAVDLLDTATARVKIEQSARPDELVALESQQAALERELAARERELSAGRPVREEEGTPLEARLAATRDAVATLRARWEQERTQAAAVHKAQAELDAAGEGADREALKAAVAEARASLAKLQGESPLVHVDVDADVVARVVAGWTGVPVGKMRSGSLGAVLALEETLRSRVRGQDAALRAVAETLRMAHAGIRNPGTPVGVLLFVGPSGVGKTETALALADTLYGGERFLTTINMSEFQEKHTVSRLIGSPPGYVGYGEGGVLTEAVRQRPYSVVLLDECEKADLEVMNLFYQVFDKGMLSDGEGRLIDFRNTVIILTSNLATDALMQLYSGPEAPGADVVSERIRPILSRHFKPALLARMTVVPYAPIPSAVLKDIAAMKLSSLAARLHASHRVRTEFAPEVTEEFARRCLDPDSGARNVDHLLRASLMPRLSRELLERLATGSVPGRLRVGLQPDGQWDIAFSEA